MASPKYERVMDQWDKELGCPKSFRAMKTNAQLRWLGRVAPTTRGPVNRNQRCVTHPAAKAAGWDAS